MYKLTKIYQIFFIMYITISGLFKRGEQSLESDCYKIRDEPVFYDEGRAVT